MKDQNSSSFTRFGSVLHDSAELFSDSYNFLKSNRAKPNFMTGTNSAEMLNYLVYVCVFKYQKFEGAKFFDIHYISMHSHDSPVLFSDFWKFLKLKKSDLIFWGRREQFCRTAELSDRLICISILKSWRAKILHSLDLITFCMFQQYFSQIFTISRK